MSANANLDLYFPESKWRGTTEGGAIRRSLVFHALVGTVVVFLAALTHKTALAGETNAVWIELAEPDHRIIERSVAGATARYSTTRMDPDASPVELPMPVSAVPNLQRAPLPNQTSQTESGAIPLSTVPITKYRSTRIVQHKPRVQVAFLPKGIGAQTVGSPMKTRTAGNPVGTLPVTPEPAKPQSHASTFGTEPEIPANRTFYQLDSEACAVFFKGEPYRYSDPPKAAKAYEKAKQLMHAATLLLSREGQEESALMAEALRNTARCYDRLKDTAKAVALHEQSIAMYEKLEGPNSKGKAISMVYLADVLHADGRSREAAQLLVASLPLYEQHFGAKSQEVAWTYNRLRDAYAHMGQTEKAAEAEQQAQRIKPDVSIGN